MKKRKKLLTPERLMLISFFGAMFTAGSLSFGFFFLSLGLIGAAWDEIAKRNKKRSRHGARP